MKFKSVVAWVLLVSTFGFYSNSTFAEEADGEAMEEVIVTATYRDTRLRGLASDTHPRILVNHTCL